MRLRLQAALRPRARPLLAGIVASLLAGFALLSYGEDLLETQRELFFDNLTQWVAAPQSPYIKVIDIDRQALQGAPDGRWGRSETARLLKALSSARPRVLAVDLVFSADCEAADVDNAALADAIGQVPVALGFLIADRSTQQPRPVPPVAIRKPLVVPDLWFIEGTEGSCPLFQDRAKAAAAAFLVGDEDARVRRVQAYAILGNTAYPALGIEAARWGFNGRTPVLGGSPPDLRLGPRLVPLDGDGSLRFAASPASVIEARTVSAGSLVDGSLAPQDLAGKVVFLGSSLPNLGGLRSSASMPLQPSVQIHADIANALMTGFIPYRDPRLLSAEAGFVVLAGIFLSLVATRLRPLMAAGLGVLTIALVSALAALIYALSARLVDAVGISLGITAVLVLTSTLQFALVRRAETAARAKFSQYLPQSVVSRFMDDPQTVRSSGEERQVTALFTDIEGFSELAQRLGPRDLIAVLDIYFAEVTALVSAHGGMVDKIVGDAVHALFNAPEDLEGHVGHAIACARAIGQLTEEMRQRPQFCDCGFGRTRIGVETGMAVLGEVGAGGRLDYTAHGDAVNLAARLQDANKFLGTSICIGPQAAAESGMALRPLGRHTIRGFGEMELFTLDQS